MKDWYKNLLSFSSNANTNPTQYIGQGGAVFIENEDTDKSCECTSTEDKSKQASLFSQKSIILNEKDGLKLVASECSEYAKISIQNKIGKDLESYQILKNGHTYRELIPQALWESKLENYESLTKS